MSWGGGVLGEVGAQGAETGGATPTDADAAALSMQIAAAMASEPAAPGPDAARLNAAGTMPEAPAVRRDQDLLDLDVEAALSRGLLREGTARRAMFTEAAIAASWRAERLGIGPHPLRFLAGYVRSAGRSAALELPEPLIGDAPARLARDWIAAACAAGAGIGFDDMFAQWLEMVAALIAVRRVAQRRGGGA